MDGCGNDKDRGTFVEKKPYAKGRRDYWVFEPAHLERPNPNAVSNVNISYMWMSFGWNDWPVLHGCFLRAVIVLDLKPYTPSIDRVEHSSGPNWCSHWPKSYEESG